MPAPRHLDDDLGERFDGWLRESLARHSPPLTFREIRKGVQALSALYVEGRAEGELARRSLGGAGKRAAFATYYAALHWVTAYHLVRELPETAVATLDGCAEIVDLGCGTGACGAAVASALRERSPERECRVLGLDRSRRILDEARATYRAFDVPARVRRAALPEALRAGAGRLALAGWSINELSAGERGGFAVHLVEHLDRGGAALVIEPLAGPATPWWAEWCEKLASRGGCHGLWKACCERHPWVAHMDKAARLDHRVLGARWLLAPAAPDAVG